MWRRLSLHRVDLVGAAAAALTLAVVVHVTDPWPALRSSRPGPLLVAAVLYAASLALWSAAWVSVLARANDGVRVHDSLAVSLASNIGVLTPMNIGTDLLRSFYGKSHLGLPYPLTAAASVITRTFKLHVTLLLLLLVAVMSVLGGGDLAGSVIFPAALVVLLLSALYALRTRASSRLARRLQIVDIAGPIRTTSLRLTPYAKGAIYLAFVTGFSLEWISLHLCTLALGMTVPLVDTMVLFGLLYILSRTPGIPQGFGVVEATGFTVLRTMDVAAAQAGALLVLWGALRVLVPLGLALVFSLELGRLRRTYELGT